MRVLLIGCGKTGSAIAEKIVRLKRIDTLSLYSRSLETSQNLAVNLKNNKIKVIKSLNKRLNNLDYVILALSGMSRIARFRRMQKFDTSHEVIWRNISCLNIIVSFRKTINFR